MTFAVCIHGRALHHEAARNEPCSDCEEVAIWSRLERYVRADMNRHPTPEDWEVLSETEPRNLLRELDAIRARRNAPHDTEVFSSDDLKTTLTEH